MAAGEIVHAIGEIAGDLSHANVVRKIVTGEELSIAQRTSLQGELVNTDTDGIEGSAGEVVDTIKEVASAVGDGAGDILDFFSKLF